MRERTPTDEAVAQRLRSVLPAQAAGPPTPSFPIHPRASSPARPAGAPPGLAELAEVGDPLEWSDIIPGWPDDVDLEAAPSAVFPPSLAAEGPAEPGRPPVVPPQPDSYRPGTPWSTPPAARPAPAPADPAASPAPTTPPGLTALGESSAHAAIDEPAAAALRGGTAAYRVVGAGDLGTSHLADVIPQAEPFVAPEPAAGASGRPLPPPAWVLPQAEGEPPPSANFVFDPDRERFALTSSNLPEPDESPGLSAAGAFGGGSAGGGRRFGLGAFDPGRRGVRALAVVAAVVIVLAAVLAWRARPQVDPVAPPPLNAAGTGAGGDQDDVPVSAGGSASAPAELVVAVGGKVHKPGLVRLPAGARVADALTAAGGAQPGVDVAVLNLARKVVDGELIMVGVTPPPGITLPTGPAVPGGGSPGPGSLVNLNTATLADLDGLPGVGPVLAQRILDARDAQGGFKAVGDLRKVDGIGDARYEQLKDLVTV